MPDETNQAAPETETASPATKKPRRETTTAEPNETSLLADLEAAEKRLAEAVEARNAADLDLMRARAALGAFLCPEGAAPGEKFQVWVNGANGRRLLSVERSPRGEYAIADWQPRGGARRP